MSSKISISILILGAFIAIIYGICMYAQNSDSTVIGSIQIGEVQIKLYVNGNPVEENITQTFVFPNEKFKEEIKVKNESDDDKESAWVRIKVMKNDKSCNVNDFVTFDCKGWVNDEKGTEYYYYKDCLRAGEETSPFTIEQAKNFAGEGTLELTFVADAVQTIPDGCDSAQAAFEAVESVNATTTLSY